MSQIVTEETGIERATLYKYQADVEAILVAWHERHVADHLEELAEAFALICHERRRAELAALLHRGERVTRAEERLKALLKRVIAECGW